jgi:hypothetical protein
MVDDTPEQQTTEVAEVESPTADPVDEIHETEVVPSEPNPEQPGGTVYDAPNQQAVGQPHPSVEGTGGTPGDLSAGTTVEETPAGEPDLDAMTKNELLAYAEQHDISPANAGMNKDELKASIEAAG